MNSVISYISLILLIIFISVTAFSCNQTSSESTKKKSMNIIWKTLSTDGLTDNLSKGVSATYAAYINGNLIVAGGANFPDRLGFEGGSKAFYDEIMIYDNTTESWKNIGHLYTPSAYGVSVSLPEGALWIGGNNDIESLNSCFYIKLTSEDSLVIEKYISLPSPMDNFSGSSIDDIVFIAGGNVNGKPSNKVFTINTKTDSLWTELTDYPGIPRVQPVMTSIVTEGKTFVYLMGGFYGGDENQKPVVATEILRYDVTSQEWLKVGEQVDPVTGIKFSLGGATAFSIDNRYILCLGGVNYDIFLDAITTQYNIGFNTKLSPQEKKEQNQNFSKHYMTQPVDYYKFNSECRVYDTLTGDWKTIDITSNAARAGAALVYEHNRFYVIQGELKPGLRSPETYMGIVILDLP